MLEARMSWIVLVLGFVSYHGLVRLVAGSGGSDTTLLCPDYEFHCPHTGVCLNRVYRCVSDGNSQLTDDRLCFNPDTGYEEGCTPTRYDLADGRLYYSGYEVFDGWTPLPGSGSISRSRLPRLKHQFITYRGFTYEFGLTYKLKELDINDPNYKYKDGASLTSYGAVGSSTCKREDFAGYLDYWRKERYNLFVNNCQNFAGGLKNFLLSDCATWPARNRRSTDFQTQNGTTDEYYAYLSNCTACSDIPGCVYNNNITSDFNVSDAVVSQYNTIYTIVCFSFSYLWYGNVMMSY